MKLVLLIASCIVAFRLNGDDEAPPYIEVKTHLALCENQAGLYCKTQKLTESYGKTARSYNVYQKEDGLIFLSLFLNKWEFTNALGTSQLKKERPIIPTTILEA